MPTNIHLIIFDVDGVLTDGSITINDAGIESVRFCARDGLGFILAKRVGLKVGVLTARSTRALAFRMAVLGVELVLRRVPDKATGLAELCRRAEVAPEQTAFVGDDLVDLAAMTRCGYPIAVGDAVAEVKAEARYVTTAPGGHGAAREAIEHILKAQGKWEQALAHYRK